MYLSIRACYAALAFVLDKAGIPRRRHGQGHRGSSRGNRAYLTQGCIDVSGELVSVWVSVSASWNASLMN